MNAKRKTLKKIDPMAIPQFAGKSDPAETYEMPDGAIWIKPAEAYEEKNSICLRTCVYVRCDDKWIMMLDNRRGRKKKCQPLP